jgi:2-keto-4-pentenoate hydratase/2-oxohepta-3-ene-1,7-dioic acid hydratase in catechol pathway
MDNSLAANPIQAGWVMDEMVGPLTGDIFQAFQREEATIPLSQVRLLPPIVPGKIVCVGRNYVEHAKEHHAPVPEIPLLFLKPPSSLIGIEDTIVLPPQSRQVEHEGELCVVIGKRGRWIEAADAARHILGFTIANDVTARDLQRTDNQWTRAKGFDTFCAIGPWVDTEFDPTDALISVHVNGVMRQMGSTSEMVFKVEHLIAFISTVMTLEPGDLILTGTPAGVGPLVHGDRVEVSIRGLGTLSNPVVKETGHLVES